MFFFLVHTFISLLELFVIYLTITKLVFDGNVFLSYVPFTLSQMPVTTRSQFKRLQNTSCNHSFSSTLGL